jgi:glycosyltransferase involved in cell wall biosynthesis
VINPNNPTGALYADDLLMGIVAIAREHGLVIFADEVSPDLEPMIHALVSKFPNRISFATVKKKLNSSNMHEKFANSRVYIGASRSDGISTSFLEALVLGAYPIQTNTSCGNEWVEKGFHAHLIEPSQNAIFDALMGVDSLSNLEEMRLHNKALAFKYLRFETIKLESARFYGVLQ